MVLDTLGCAQRYAALHRRFGRAFRFLAETDLDALPTGRSDILGPLNDDMFAIIERRDGRGREAARLEAHRRYIDIQYTVRGDEEIGWTPLSSCVDPDGSFDPSRDIVFFRDRPSTWLHVPPGGFAIFFPGDAHAPLAGKGAMVKAIVKIGG
jgi:YhcH/YjgK/YiaL family protein